MGAGFVFLVWMVLACAGFAFLSLAVSVVAYLLSAKPLPSKVKRRRIIGAIGYPPLMVACCGGFLIANGIWCEMVRGVDIGFGDGFHVPVVDDIQLSMIDTTDAGSLYRQGKRIELDGWVVDIGQTGQLVYGKTVSQHPLWISDKEPQKESHFALDTSSGHAQTYPDLRSLQNAHKKEGSLSPLKSVGSFYYEKRFGLQDVLAGVCFITLLLTFSIYFWRSVLRMPN